jgi:hypothetical protein
VGRGLKVPAFPNPISKRLFSEPPTRTLKGAVSV